MKVSVSSKMKHLENLLKMMLGLISSFCSQLSNSAMARVRAQGEARTAPWHLDCHQ